jgi:hypothetical protein
MKKRILKKKKIKVGQCLFMALHGSEILDTIRRTCAASRVTIKQLKSEQVYFHILALIDKPVNKCLHYHKVGAIYRKKQRQFSRFKQFRAFPHILK